MTDYTRVSVTGSARRADLVVPSDEPLGAVLPRLLDLLGETGGTVARPVTLVSSDGEQLDIARTAQQLELLDGSALRLVRLDEAPPPPVVIDLTDVAADAHDTRPQRWDERARLRAGMAGLAATAAVAGLVAPVESGAHLAGVVGAFAIAVAISVVLGLVRMPRAALLAVAAAAGFALPLGAVAMTVAGGAGLTASALPLGVAAGAASAFAAVALGVGLGGRRGGALGGGIVGAALNGLLVVLLALGVEAAPAAAVVGTVAAFAIGLLPWIALSSAGLTGLDQRAADGERVSRTTALDSIDEAYAALGWSVAGVASVFAVTGVVLVLADDLWWGLLALAIGLVAALRTRAFPLRAHVAVLWAAVGVVALAAVTGPLADSDAWWAVAVCAAAAVLLGAAVLVRPRPHVRARLRGLGNVVELLAVVALLPLLLGGLGVYADLLAMFGGGA